MAITDNEIQMAFRIKRCVKEFFDTHIQIKFSGWSTTSEFSKASRKGEAIRFDTSSTLSTKKYKQELGLYKNQLMMFDSNDIEAIESDFYKDGQKNICKK